MIGTDFSKIDLDKYYFDERSAQVAVDFIENECNHTTGKWASKFDRDGKPQSTLIKLADWQKHEIVRPLFGWKDKQTGYRKYTELYVEVAKKNAKSTLAACLQNIFLFIDPEKGSEIYAACPSSKEQAAALLMEPCRQMIDANPKLKEKARIYGTPNNTKSILVGKTIFKPMTSSPDAGEGVKPQAGFMDETHVFKDGRVASHLEKGPITRDQSLVCYTTTAGSDTTGFGYEKSEYYKKVANGVIENESALVCIYCADKGDDPFIESTWKKGNPMWDISINQKYFRGLAEKAKHSAAELNSFKRYHLNIWTNSKDVWIPDHELTADQEKIDWYEFEGCECYGGLDLSSSRDITALTLMFRRDEKYYSFNLFWLPKDKKSDEVSKRRMYPQWIKDGLLLETPGNIIDYDRVREDINYLKELYNIKGIFYDPYNKAQIIPKMIEEDGHTMIEHRQGTISMNTPMMFLDAMVAKRAFKFDNNPILRWMFSNVTVHTDSSGNIKVDRKERSTEKNDGVITNIMAMSGWVEEPEEQGSYLEDGELMIL